MTLLSNVGFIPFCVFRFLVKVTKNEKISCHFLAKCGFFYTENKQTGQLIFLFLITLTKKRKMEWTGHKCQKQVGDFFKFCGLLRKPHYLLCRFYKNPSLNTQSCNRRPLCSTFTFENLRSPKKTSFIPIKNQKKIKNIFFLNFLCNFLVRTL